MADDITKTQHIKNVVTILSDYVKVAKVEKKIYGEVFTPNPLVNNMMDTLPVSVWSNPDLKWLDPCSGVGIFPAVIIERLMFGLQEIITDEELRYKHIVENMIYMAELQPRNSFVCSCAFDPKNEYSMNVYTGSFLSEEFDFHMKEIWGVDKFDVIVQNPPYQTNNPGEKKTHPIWDKFVKKALDVCVEGGYMVAVHPSGWRNVDGRFKDTQVLLRSKQMMYLEIHNEKDGLKTFGAETRYDFYCVKNIENNSETLIKGQDNSIEFADISKMEFIPNDNFKKIFSLVAKPGEEKVDVLYSRSSYETRKECMSKEQTDEFKYPCAYTVTKGDILKLFFSSINDKGHFGISKLIWSNGNIFSVGSVVDENGEYGLTQFSYAITDSKEKLPLIKRAFDSKKFRALMEDCAVGYMSINYKAISTFRKDFWKEFLD
jgi:hypothetical protein